MDASFIGVGVFLFQKRGKWKNWSWSLSKAFSPAQKNYSIENQKLLANKLALEEGRHLLKWARHTATIYTIHKDLLFVQSAHCQNPCQAHWSLFLSSFDLFLYVNYADKNVKACLWHTTKIFVLQKCRKQILFWVILPSWLLIWVYTIHWIWYHAITGGPPCTQNKGGLSPKPPDIFLALPVPDSAWRSSWYSHPITHSPTVKGNMSIRFWKTTKGILPRDCCASLLLSAEVIYRFFLFSSLQSYFKISLLPFLSQCHYIWYYNHYIWYHTELQNKINMSFIKHRELRKYKTRKTNSTMASFSIPLHK